MCERGGQGGEDGTEMGRDVHPSHRMGYISYKIGQSKMASLICDLKIKDLVAVSS